MCKDDDSVKDFVRVILVKRNRTAVLKKHDDSTGILKTV